MNPRLRIVGIGEVLMDRFSDGSETLGGAPFNVAFHAQQLLRADALGTGVVVSAVGDDASGQAIVRAAELAGMPAQFLHRNAQLPSGFADVFLRGGEAGYDIPPGQAWDAIPWGEPLDELAQNASAVAFGSLAQRAAHSRETIQRFVGQVRGHRLFDVNLRQNSTDGARGYSAEVLAAGCRLATVVKCNEAELEELGTLVGLSAPGSSGGSVRSGDRSEARLATQMEQLRTAFDLVTVVVTRGPLGAMLRSAEGTLRLPDSTLAPGSIHPVGAGDAFSAGLLCCLSRGFDLARSARFADRLASWVTGYPSATPALTPAILADLRAIASGT